MYGMFKRINKVIIFLTSLLFLGSCTKYHKDKNNKRVTYKYEITHCNNLHRDTIISYSEPYIFMGKTYSVPVLKYTKLNYMVEHRGRKSPVIKRAELLNYCSYRKL